jgi:hypothetical protein
MPSRNLPPLACAVSTIVPAGFIAARPRPGIAATAGNSKVAADHELVRNIRRRRAARLGLPEPEDVPVPAFPPGMSLGEMTIASRVRQHPLCFSERLLRIEGHGYQSCHRNCFWRA